MAEDTSASVISLHQVPQRKDKTGAARAKAYRERKKQRGKPAEVELPCSESLPLPEFSPAASAVAVTTVAPPVVTPRRDEPATPPTVTIHPIVTPPRHNLASILLMTAALALSAVGITINGWFARSLGATDVAGWLFLAVGVAADVVALMMPSCAAALWHGRRRTTAVAGWTIWLVAFVFAVTAGIGFAATNISDVTLLRASRATPTVTAARAALASSAGSVKRLSRSAVSSSTPKWRLSGEWRTLKPRQPSGSSPGAPAAGCGRRPKTSPWSGSSYWPCCHSSAA